MTTIAMKLRPWVPPNFASLEQPVGKRQDGIQPSVSIPLADLDQAALNGLVREWLQSVYHKAGKPNPWVSI
jgi:hypothetical protein